LGRIHDVEDVGRAFTAARAAGFDNINLDFIFGLPDQRRAAWADTLDQALALGPEHLSLYSLIVEPETPLQHWVATGKAAAPDDDLAAELYELAAARLAAAGYTQYEVSNWAKDLPGAAPHAGAGAVGGADVGLSGTENPGYACRHNLVYWRNQEYIGVGPGAHSHLRQDAAGGERISRRWSNRKPVPGYVKRVLQGAAVVDFAEELSPRAAMGETMMLGLRLVREGVSFDRFAETHGVDLRAVFELELARLHAWGLLEADAARVRLTRQGLMVGNQVFAAFLAD
jgi:oxygen-independent coproporphyrinogen-3 oxidase